MYNGQKTLYHCTPVTGGSIMCLWPPPGGSNNSNFSAAVWGHPATVRAVNVRATLASWWPCAARSWHRFQSYIYTYIYYPRSQPGLSTQAWRVRARHAVGTTGPTESPVQLYDVGYWWRCPKAHPSKHRGTAERARAGRERPARRPEGRVYNHNHISITTFTPPNIEARPSASGARRRSYTRGVVRTDRCRASLKP